MRWYVEADRGSTMDIGVAERTTLRMVWQHGGGDIVPHGGATRRTGEAQRMGLTANGGASRRTGAIGAAPSVGSAARPLCARRWPLAMAGDEDLS